jgi:Ca-activated chloride channel family protein
MTLWGMHIAFPWALAALVALPIVLLLARGWTRPRRARATISSVSLVEGLPRTIRSRLLWIPGLLRLVAMILLILAIARPQFGVGRVQTSTEAIAIQLAIDRSASMLEPMDYGGTTVSRFEAVQRVLRDFLVGNGDDMPGRPHDLIGVIAFAGTASTVCPLVRDPHAVADLIDMMQAANRRAEPGTAIGDGLALAAARLRRAEEDLASRDRPNTQSASAARASDFTLKSKVVILLSDGANNAGELDPLEAAELAGEWGIKVYTIGIGSSLSVFRTPTGEQAMRLPSDLDEPRLRAVAERTGGVYRRADSAESLIQIYRLEKTSVSTAEFTDYLERFMPLALAACAVLALEMLLTATWLRRGP